MRTAHHNAIAILRAASHRRCGSRSWAPRNGLRCNVSLSTPSRNVHGWFAFTWHDGKRQCTVDLARRRGEARTAARSLIEAAHAPDVRTAWRQAQIAANKGARGLPLWHAIAAITGAMGAYDGSRGRLGSRLQRLLDSPVEGSERYQRTRTVLNCFGRLNPWNPRSAARGPNAYCDTTRVRALRARLLRRRMIAPEPGGYVTGLLSEAPPRMWWEDHPSLVAPFDADDVAIYEGSPDAIVSEGETAARAGVKWWDNPYPSGSAEAGHWDKGLTAVRCARRVSA